MDPALLQASDRAEKKLQRDCSLKPRYMYSAPCPSISLLAPNLKRCLLPDNELLAIGIAVVPLILRVTQISMLALPPPARLRLQRPHLIRVAPAAARGSRAAHSSAVVVGDEVCHESAGGGDRGGDDGVAQLGLGQADVRCFLE